MTRYSLEPRTIKYVKVYGFLSFARKFEKLIKDEGLNASIKVVHKTGEL